jgi:hypothetical protein
MFKLTIDRPGLVMPRITYHRDLQSVMRGLEVALELAIASGDISEAITWKIVERIAPYTWLDIDAHDLDRVEDCVSTMLNLW